MQDGRDEEFLDWLSEILELDDLPDDQQKVSLAFAKDLYDFGTAMFGDPMEMGREGKEKI